MPSLLTADSPRRRTVMFAVGLAFAWAAMFGFGGIAVETIVIYPNVFHDAPDSLALAVDFFAVTGPADFFPPMGAATVVLAVAMAVTAFPDRSARLWTFGALGTLVIGEFLFSVLFFWPRNEIMFDEGVAVHSAETLRRVAFEFETGHRFRLAMSGLTATFALMAAFATHRRLRAGRD